MTPAAWQLHRRADRRDALVKGSGFHAFKDYPEAWRHFIMVRCQFCKRGPNELDGLFALDGLPDMPRPMYCCNDCARDIVDGKMPTGWGESTGRAPVQDRQRGRAKNSGSENMRKNASLQNPDSCA